MILSTLHTSVDRVDRWLDDLRHQLTPGQRWTSALGMALALTLVLFGLPTHVRVSDTGQETAQAPRRPAEASPTTSATNIPTAPGPVPAVEPPTPGGVQRDEPDQTSGPPTGLLPAPTDAEPATIVALVRSGDGVPGRDDEAMARSAIDGASVPIVITPFHPADGNTCSRVSAEADVVLAVSELGELRDCLVGNGVVVVSRDPRGGVTRSAGGGQALSTRPGPVESLLAITEPTARQLVQGRVGLVAQDTARPAVEQAINELESAGIDVVATTYLAGDTAGSAAITDGIRAFSRAGVSTVVFAVPVSQQRAWTAQEVLLLPDASHVVVDAADSIAEETYPRTFEGAVAVTTMRAPWYERTHGATREQQACTDRWAQPPVPGTLTADERVSLFAWCDIVAVAEAGTAAAADGNIGETLRSTTAAAALTSNLGPLPNAGWGPREVAILTWKAACSCWQEQKPFTKRTRF